MAPNDCRYDRMGLLTFALFQAVGVNDCYLADDTDPLDKETAGSARTLLGQRPGTYVLSSCTGEEYVVRV